MFTKFACPAHASASVVLLVALGSMQRKQPAIDAWSLVATSAICASTTTTSSSLGSVVLDCQTAPTATQGCTSIASSTGTPSASTGTLIVAFAQLNVQTLAVVFYGISGPTSLPWNAQSTLCVKAPTERLSEVPGATGSTGGTLGGCNGVRAFEFNSVIQGAYPGYLGTPMSPGQTVVLQAWQRDPAASNTTSLSDALQLVVLP